MDLLLEINISLAIAKSIIKNPGYTNRWSGDKINKKNSLTTSFSVQNIGNTTYRDYLNRQRFFVDEMGRNIQIQLKFNY